MAAARNGHEQCMNTWIDAGADVNASGHLGGTALIWAIDSSGACVDSLIKAGADVNKISDDFNGALHCAAYTANFKSIDLLLKVGAHVNIQGSDGDTALLKSVRTDHIIYGQSCGSYATENHSHWKSVELLLEAGADVNIVNNYGNTALTLACTNGYFKAVDLLMKAGADVNKPSMNNDTALMLACRRGHIKTVKLLLRAGADVNMVNNKGFTALFTQYRYPKYFKKCVKALLRADVPINEVNHLSRNALAEVLQHNDDEVSKLLFAAGETLDNVTQSKIPDCLKFEDLQFQLKHICRETIRKHLFDLDPHHHLFGRIPKLGLPNALSKYLVYDESLDESDEDEDNNNDDENSI